MLINYIYASLNYVVPGMFSYLILRVLYKAILKYQNKKTSLLTEIVSFCLSIYMIIMFSATISPVFGFNPNINLNTRINLIPFYTIGEYINSITLGSYHINLNFFGNIIMFIPLGISYPIISNRYERFIPVLITGFLTSSLIEFCQLFLSRGTDIDDVILNTFGTILGYTIYKTVIRIFPLIRTLCGTIKIINEEKNYFPKDGKYIIVCTFVMATCVCITGFTKFSTTQNFPTQFSTPPEKMGMIKVSMQDSINLVANNACVYSIDENDFIFSKGLNDTIAPASTTKLLTAMVVLDNCSLDEIVTVGNEISLIAPNSSTAHLKLGDKCTIKMLLEALLLPSGNDAAYVLANYVGNKMLEQFNITNHTIEDSIYTFIETMNQKAQNINAVCSNFTTPDGFDSPNQYTTVKDMTIISKEFLNYNTLKEIVSKPIIHETFLNGQEVTYKNTNLLLDKNSPYFNKNVKGLKTGSSNKAGCCLISTAIINKRSYIIIVMDSTKEGRYLDTLELLNSL